MSGLPGPSLILAGRLIDGTGSSALLDQAILIKDGIIEAVLPQAELTRPQYRDSIILEIQDGTVLPGLIDAHVHLTFSGGASHDEVRGALERETDAELEARAVANAQAHLAGGVTTVRDVGCRGFVALGVRDRIRRGETPGPRILCSGPAITTSRGHLFYLGAVADGEAEVRARAREALERGADLLKICATGGIMTAESEPTGSQYSVEELRAAVEVAESAGTLVAAHVLATEALGRCVEAGVRSLEHCMMQVETGVCRFDEEIAARIRERGFFAGFTFSGLSRARYREEVLGETVAEALGPWRQRMEVRYATERRLIDSGIRWVLHSDSGVRGTPFGTFWLSVASASYELGITPLEAIRAVTSTAAELLGLGASIVTVAPGKRADLLIVEGDPASDLRRLRNPRYVLQDGRIAAMDGVLQA